jgi:phosphate transport system permease protein
MMSFPTVTMLAASSIKGVNPAMELGSLALGASKTQTNFKVVLTSARGGIFAGLILGIDRALGEATAVSLVAGNAASGPNWNLFGITRTLTTSMLTGMNEATGLNYDIRFSVGILLIVLIVIVNALLEIVKRRLERK